MPAPVEDLQVLKAIKLRYHGRELEAMLLAWEDIPTHKEDCKVRRSQKESERMKHMVYYLKKLQKTKKAKK